MTYLTVKKAFVDWVKVSTGFNTAHVIFADQNMPRPNKPYITLKLTSFNQINRAYIGNIDSNGFATVVSDKEFSLLIECFGDDSSNIPIEILLNLHDSLDQINIYKILQDEEVAFVDDLLGPTDTSVLLDMKYERRANMDLLMRMPWSVQDVNQGIIEEVHIDEVIIEQGGGTVRTETIIIDSTP